MKTNHANAEKVSPFACDMSAIEASRRGQHIAMIDELFHAVGKIRELPDDYAFRLPNESDVGADRRIVCAPS